MPDAVFIGAREVAYPDPATAPKDGRQRYATSKLCNIFWTYALARHAKESGKNWTVVAVDPGLMPGTGLAREYSWFLKWLWNSVLPRMIPVLRVLVTPNTHTVLESGTSIGMVATGEVEVESGVYLEGKKVIKSSVDSYDVGKQEDLWGFTAKLVAKDEAERVRFETLG